MSPLWINDIFNLNVHIPALANALIFMKSECKFNLSYLCLRMSHYWKRFFPPQKKQGILIMQPGNGEGCVLLGRGRSDGKNGLLSLEWNTENAENHTWYLQTMTSQQKDMNLLKDLVFLLTTVELRKVPPPQRFSGFLFTYGHQNLDIDVGSQEVSQVSLQIISY